ncbi:MAG: hypothetical protein NVSMB62_19000 [Acidobacteriaceae bacterium]
MKLLVLVLDAHDDLDRVLLVWRRHFDGLEAPLEGAILLDRLAVLGGGGGSDALDLATAECGLEDVCGVERTFGGACADEGVELVDEDDGVLVLHQLLHDGLEAFFKLAAIFCSCHNERKIEREDALVGKEGWHFAVSNLLRETFDDRGLADAGFADEDGIVLGAAAEDLYHTVDLCIAADQRIKLLIHGGLGEIAGELGEHGLFAALALGSLLRGGFLLRGALELLADGGETQAAFSEDLRGEALLLAQQAEQQVFGADVLVREALGLFCGVGEHALAFV